MANNNNANGRRWATIVIYRECQRNHSIQPHRLLLLDGCPDFVNLDHNATPELALYCATCGCHRQYHRREEVMVQVEPATVEVIHQLAVGVAAPPPHHHHGGAPLPAPQEEDGHHPVPEENLGDGEVEEEKEGEEEWRPEWVVRRRERRTRFTPEQRQAMRAYADGLEWRLQGHCEESLCRFCEEIGVSPQVFKVWMKNNKRKYYDVED